MDGPNAQYLRPIAGLDAAMWVPPSRGQLFWLRRAPALFAPARGTGRGLARWWAIATVAPGTNVTGLNLAYQSYLNHVFHRTRLARVGHAACMPVIVTALLALLYPGPRHASRPPRPGGVVGVLGGQGTRPGVGRLCRRPGRRAVPARAGARAARRSGCWGHDPVRRAAWRAPSARAIASGSPALDYIGTGGPTPLRSG